MVAQRSTALAASRRDGPLCQSMLVDLLLHTWHPNRPISLFVALTSCALSFDLFPSRMKTLDGINCRLVFSNA